MPKPEVREISERTYRVAHLLAAPVFRAYFRVRISGIENLPSPGQATILTVNHTSALDMFAIGYALGRPSYFIAKLEATRWPLIGPFFLNVGAIPARRDGRDTDVLRRMLKLLRQGALVGVAPEGTRSNDGRLQPFDPGFVWLAVRTGATILPGAVHGAYALMPPHARLPRPGPLWVRFGEPIRFEGEARRVDRERLAELATEVRARTLELLNEMAAESGIPCPGPEEEA